MRRLQIGDAETVRIAAQQEIMRSGESRYDHRLHGILLICSGLSCYEVAELLGHSPRTVESWVEHFERSGFAALHDRERPGRPSKLTEADRAALEQDLRCPPADFGYAQNNWDGKLLSHHLVQNFAVRLKVRQCQRLFHQFRFRRRKPRPVIAHADPELQQAYKKTRKTGWTAGD